MLRGACRVLRAAGAAAQGPFDPFRILGLPPNAGPAEVKRAYHRLALRYHPDGGPEGNTARFQAVNEAYQAIKSGNWRPQEGGGNVGESKGHGWDPKMGMYVYEQPGSTTENYVDSRTQTLLRLCVLWTMAFVVVRFFLLWIFPHVGAAPTVEWAVEDENSDSTQIVESSVHGESSNTVRKTLDLRHSSDILNTQVSPISVSRSPEMDPLHRN